MSVAEIYECILKEENERNEKWLFPSTRNTHYCEKIYTNLDPKEELRSQMS